MKINKKWLKEKNACKEGVVWFCGQKEKEGIKVVKKLMTEKQYEWANWLIVRIMEYKQYVSYGVFAAEQVLPFFEKKYPNDKRPREAIEAAKRCIENPSKENKAASFADSSAASSAAYSAASFADSSTASFADSSAAYYAASSAASSAASFADSSAAYYAASSAAYSAASFADSSAAYYAAKEKMQIKILNYGLSLLKQQRRK